MAGKKKKINEGLGNDPDVPIDLDNGKQNKSGKDRTMKKRKERGKKIKNRKGKKEEETVKNEVEDQEMIEEIDEQVALPSATQERDRI